MKQILRGGLLGFALVFFIVFGFRGFQVVAELMSSADDAANVLGGFVAVCVMIVETFIVFLFAKLLKRR